MTIRNKPRLKIHIFCSGEKAERQYFEDFRYYLHNNNSFYQLKLHSKNLSNKAPWQVINKAANFTKEDEEDQIWCVFDIDDFLKGEKNKTQFEKALKKSEKNNINLAWSNRCFELWFLLHFQYMSIPIVKSEECDKKLKNHLKKLNSEYKKNMGDMFNTLLSKQKEAIKNSKKLFANNKKPKDNPSTSIFRLIEILNKSLN